MFPLQIRRTPLLAADQAAAEAEAEAEGEAEPKTCAVSERFALDDWHRRAVELAEDYGMGAGAVRYGVMRADGREVFHVMSRTKPGQWLYDVVWDPEARRAMGCSCPASGPCWHAGAVILWCWARDLKCAIWKRRVARGLAHPDYLCFYGEEDKF